MHLTSTHAAPVHARSPAAILATGMHRLGGGIHMEEPHTVKRV